MIKLQSVCNLRGLGVLFLLLLSGCAMPRRAGTLPAPVTFNRDAGHGGLLIVSIRLENGEELPFAVDTGSPSTLFDQSLEPKLGPRLGTIQTSTWTREAKGGVYESPKLYLGNTRLKMTGTNIITLSLADDSEVAPPKGLLGLDVLEHYIVQLDFRAHKLRFLDTNQFNPAKLGKAYALNLSAEGFPWVRESPLTGGAATNLMIDSGCNVDGAVPPEAFCTLNEPQEPLDPASLKLDGSKHAWVEQCRWSGQTYTNLVILNGPNLVGLGFLARHLVTFDFPNRRLYLKQTSIGPLADRKRDAAMAAAEKSSLKVLRRLLDQGQLPGWSKTDRPAPGSLDCEVESLNCITTHLEKQGAGSIYHYAFSRASQRSAWKLRRAWRTDQDDHTLEEYAVP